MEYYASPLQMNEQYDSGAPSVLQLLWTATPVLPAALVGLSWTILSNTMAAVFLTSWGRPRPNLGIQFTRVSIPTTFVGHIVLGECALLPPSLGQSMSAVRIN